LRGRYVGREIGGFYVVKFGRSKPIETEIEVGDVVLISKGDPLKSDLMGTVIAKTQRSISVALNNSPPKWALSRNIRLDLFFNDITFKRMEKAIDAIEKSEESRWIRDVILQKTPPVPPGEESVTISDEDLNEFQRRAVYRSLGSRIFLIHGPPGTGKTRTLTEIIFHFVRKGKRVAVSADSNAAVDNILEKLIDKGIKALRIGHPARVEKHLIEHTLSYVVQSSPKYSRVEELLKEARKLIEIRDEFTKPEPKYRRGLSDEEIKKFSSAGKSVRGVPARLLQSMARWISLNERISDLMDKAKDLEMKIVKAKISQSEAIVGTNASFGVDYMLDEKFDCLVHDEATQSTEPSSYIPLSLSECLIMAGYHKQLPPTVTNLEAQKILSKTLFEKLFERFPEISTMLRIQYRMNEKIMEFPSKAFYEGKLIAHESVKNRSLAQLGYALRGEERFPKVLDPLVSIAIIDTSHHPGKWERQKRGSTSRENDLEASVVSKLVEDLLKMGLKKIDIGVITPYDDQVDLLKKRLPEGIKISSVDAFQGREKEVIIISFVRSNKQKELGFLEDMRRLNVSITRAKSKLIMVGDFSTLSVHPVYSSLRKYVLEKGYVEVLK
jgi:predicted DNA helicase